MTDDLKANLAGSILPVMEQYQDQVRAWMAVCFGEGIAGDLVERNDRFIEEALELVQAADGDRDRCHALVDYVFGRVVGEVRQEVGGVMVTLAALCAARGVDMVAAAFDELERCRVMVEAIRAKQAAKPVGEALPVAAGARLRVDEYMIAAMLWPNRAADVRIVQARFERARAPGERAYLVLEIVGEGLEPGREVEAELTVDPAAQRATGAVYLPVVTTFKPAGWSQAQADAAVAAARAGEGAGDGRG